MNSNASDPAPPAGHRATDPIAEIRPGLPVYGVEGELLGEVKEVAGDCFKVDAPLRPDYWLGLPDVLSFTAERVTMRFRAEALEQHRFSR